MRGKQLPLQVINDDRPHGAVNAPRIATAVQFCEELLSPLVVEVPYLQEQLLSERRSGFDLIRLHSRYDAVRGECRPFQITVLCNKGLMVNERPQPGHIDAVGGEVIHKAK